MRKVDAESFNKRLVSEILELKNLIENISPEHINQFDADLIGTANQYLSLLTDSTWADNSNFNSIELSKLKQAIAYIRTQNKEVMFNRKVYDITSVDDGYSEIGDGRYAKGHQLINVPAGFDGRLSFVYPRIILASKVVSGSVGEGEQQTPVYSYVWRYMTVEEMLTHSQSQVNIDAEAGQVTILTPAAKGDTNARLQTAKNKKAITISYNLNCRGSTAVISDLVPEPGGITKPWYDTNNPASPPATYESDVEKIYLDVFAVYWRNK